jgi:Family of unknown function (DUF6496)
MPTTASKRHRGPKRSGKSSSAHAGRYVEQEMKAMKHGSEHVTSRKQAIAVGLSEARRHGVKVPARSHP